MLSRQHQGTLASPGQSTVGTLHGQGALSGQHCSTPASPGQSTAGTLHGQGASSGQHQGTPASPGQSTAAGQGQGLSSKFIHITVPVDVLRDVLTKYQKLPGNNLPRPELKEWLKQNNLPVTSEDATQLIADLMIEESRRQRIKAVLLQPGTNVNPSTIRQAFTQDASGSQAASDAGNKSSDEVVVRFQTPNIPLTMPPAKSKMTAAKKKKKKEPKEAEKPAAASTESVPPPDHPTSPPDNRSPDDYQSELAVWGEGSDDVWGQEEEVQFPVKRKRGRPPSKNAKRQKLAHASAAHGSAHLSQPSDPVAASSSKEHPSTPTAVAGSSQSASERTDPLTRRSPRSFSKSQPDFEPSSSGSKISSRSEDSSQKLFSPDNVTKRKEEAASSSGQAQQEAKDDELHCSCQTPFDSKK